MATFVGMYDRVHLGHIDLTSLTEQVNFGDLSAVAVSFTNFGAGGFQEMKPGLISGEFSATTFQDFALDTLDDELGVAGLGTQYPVSVDPCPTGTSTAGDTAYFSRGSIGGYNPMDGAKGGAAKAMIKVPYDAALIRGQVAHPKAARTTTGTGTALVLTGPTAAQKLYLALHIFAYSGLTNVVFTVESDDNAGFTTPTTRITATTVTGVTSQFASLPGDLSTETYHRVKWTATGVGSVTFAAYLGVI